MILSPDLLFHALANGQLIEVEMKIVSSQKDYYDSARCYALCDATEPLFVRTTTELEYFPKGRQPWSWEPRDYYVWGSKLTLWKARKVDLVVVGFCGTIYPVVRLSDPAEVEANTFKTSSTIIQNHNYLYDKPTANELFNNPDAVPPSLRKLFLREFKNNKKALKSRLDNSNKSLLESYEGISLSNFESIFEEHKVPYFVILPQRHVRSKLLILNPSLEDLQFFKIFNAYRAYQELEMYFGSILVSSMDPTQITDDIVLRDSKGFDDWSFKTPPRKKRKRQKS